MNKDLNKKELLRRIDKFWDDEHAKFINDIIGTKNSNARNEVYQQLYGFNYALLSVKKIIRNYDKELNGDTFQQLKAINEELKKINEELTKKGGV